MNLNVNCLITIHAIRDKLSHAASSACKFLAGIGDKINFQVHAFKDSVCRRGKTDVYPYQHVFRRKTKWELLLLSCAVCGIEFCYSAETAYVSPILLGMGLDVEYMTMIWCLSPAIGFFLTPTLGSLSDGCRSRFGRRRPFIFILSIGIILGLIFVPNGKDIGLVLGDPLDQYDQVSNTTDHLFSLNISTDESILSGANSRSHPIGIVFTVLGVILLDFCCDACQSPSRSYLLDVTVPEQHTFGLSTFTLMAGFGGCFGYMMGAIQWEGTIFATLLGDHVRVVFVVVTILFLIAVTITLTSFPEIPLRYLQEAEEMTLATISYQRFQNEEDTEIIQSAHTAYGTLSEDNTEKISADSSGDNDDKQKESISGEQRKDWIRDTPLKEAESDPSVIRMSLQTNIKPTTEPTIKDYFRSILRLPKSLCILCVTNLFSWMSLLCYSLYFTNFVGEAVFYGDPMAPRGSVKYVLYQQGVRFGCWGMALYSLSCCFYSYNIEKLGSKIGIKYVYICGHLVYSFGMVLMSLTQNRAAVIALSPTAGIMYATLFTMPYLLVARYHFASKFDEANESKQIRGMGTDVAIVSSMVFVAQFILSLCMGSIVYAAGSSVATVCAASVLSFCGALSATRDGEQIRWHWFGTGRPSMELNIIRSFLKSCQPWLLNEAFL